MDGGNFPGGQVEVKPDSLLSALTPTPSPSQISSLSEGGFGSLASKIGTETTELLARGRVALSDMGISCGEAISDYIKVIKQHKLPTAIIAMAIGIVVLMLVRSIHALKSKNAELGARIESKNAELEDKNREIESKNAEIGLQKNKITGLKGEVRQARTNLDRAESQFNEATRHLAKVITNGDPYAQGQGPARRQMEQGQPGGRRGYDGDYDGFRAPDMDFGGQGQLPYRPPRNRRNGPTVEEVD